MLNNDTTTYDINYYNIISNININNNGTNNDRIDRDEYNNTSSVDTTSENNDFNAVNIYRYKFTKEFMEELYRFSKIHQYDHRKDFKEAWLLWRDEHEAFICEEIRRLNLLGCDKDIEDKMFKSARYYFRKKNTEKKAPSSRRDYIGTSKEFISTIDKHIKSNIGNKPSECFSQFCKENTEELQKELIRLLNGGLTKTEEIKDKIKKTYKNRYFIISKNVK
jgi:hypothetical protein